MACTFANRRQEVVNQEPSVKDFKERWPALFQQKENNAEFQRFMAIHLELKFMAQLDMHSSELIKVIHAKGEATDQKTTDIMDKDLEQLTMAVFAIHREVGRTAGAT